VFYVDNSQAEQLIQLSVIAFLRLNCLFVYPGATIDQSDVNFTFCTAEPCKKKNPHLIS